MDRILNFKLKLFFFKKNSNQFFYFFVKLFLLRFNSDLHYNYYFFNIARKISCKHVSSIKYYKKKLVNIKILRKVTMKNCGLRSVLKILYKENHFQNLIDIFYSIKQIYSSYLSKNHFLIYVGCWTFPYLPKLSEFETH